MDFSKYEKFAIDTAKSAGEIVMSYFGKTINIHTKSTEIDLVTQADLESEKYIIDSINATYPEHDIITEENDYKKSTSDYCWVIDPLDGTTNYAHGYPFFATSIGLIWNNCPILGAISIPYLNEIYYASPEHGSFCNGKKINVTKTGSLSDSLLVTGFAYDRHELLDNNYSEFCWLTHRTHGVRRGGAAAVDLAFVASGRVDGYWERGLSKWDMAAGVPLVEMAGGLVSNYSGEDYDIDSGRILACNPEINKELIDELKKVRPLSTDSYGGKGSKFM